MWEKWTVVIEEKKWNPLKLFSYQANCTGQKPFSKSEKIQCENNAYTVKCENLAQLRCENLKDEKMHERVKFEHIFNKHGYM